MLDALNQCRVQLKRDYGQSVGMVCASEVGSCDLWRNYEVCVVFRVVHSPSIGTTKTTAIPSGIDQPSRRILPSHQAGSSSLEAQSTAPGQAGAAAQWRRCRIRTCMLSGSPTNLQPNVQRAGPPPSRIQDGQFLPSNIRGFRHHPGGSSKDAVIIASTMIQQCTR